MNMHYDVIIVGAGPAGLAAAFELAQLDAGLSILMVDRGSSIEDRVCSSHESLCIDCRPCDITAGFGGAGLYSDGKLCLDPEVGGDILRFYTPAEAAELMQRVCVMLSSGGAVITPAIPNKKDLTACIHAFDEQGIGFKWYDVVRMGLKERIAMSLVLKQYLEEQGVKFLFNTEVRSVSKDVAHSNDGIYGSISLAAARPDSSEYTSSEYFTAEHAILAVGKLGSLWLDNVLSRQGVLFHNNPLYLGGRLEMDASVTEPIARLTDNPRMSLEIPGIGYIKTHCFSQNGRVILADYDGLKLVEGDFVEDRLSGNSAVNVVIKLDVPSYMHPYDVSRRYIEQTIGSGKGRPVVQRVGDFMKFRTTSKEALVDLEIEPTLNDCNPGNLVDSVSYRYGSLLRKFLKKVGNVLPGFDLAENIIYGPFAEWWMRKAEVDRYFETCLKGVYAIGDGAGMSQGIVAAAMQGIACARGIYERTR